MSLSQALDSVKPWCRQVVLPRAARLLGMLEPALERVVYQDIPANLLALKHRVETRRAALKVAELEQQGAPSRFRAALLAFRPPLLQWVTPCAHRLAWRHF
jgi:hypothetical protein